MDTFLNHGPLELGENSDDLKNHFPGRSGGVNPLLMAVQVNALAVKLTQERHQVRQRAPQAVDAPRGYQVNLFPGDGFMEGVKPRPTVAAQEADIAVLAIDAHSRGYANPLFSVHVARK